MVDMISPGRWTSTLDLDLGVVRGPGRSRIHASRFCDCSMNSYAKLSIKQVYYIFKMFCMSFKISVVNIITTTTTGTTTTIITTTITTATITTTTTTTNDSRF